MKASIDYSETREKQLLSKKIKKGITYTLLGIWALVVLFPFYWMLLSSFKSYGEYNGETVPNFIAKNPTFENYITAFTEVSLLDYFVNTLIFTLATTARMMIIIIPAAFAFARLNFKGKNILFVVFLSLMMIPNELVVITNFVTITSLDL